jgi:hypothetical protein
MQTALNEQIEVLAKFHGGSIVPLLFKFGQRIIKVKSIDLRYDFRRDNVHFYSFSVSSGPNSYKITFNTQSLKWILEEVFQND